MATAVPESAAPSPEAAVSYGKRDNIGVPGSDPNDAVLTVTGTRAAARETDRTKSNLHSSGVYQPDQADYVPTGSERG